jgi:hypothetical protein
MTLRKDAEKAAERVSMTLADCNPTGPYAQKKIADAIEATAKRFAERALRKMFHSIGEQQLDCFCGAHEKEVIAEALAAAEREET